MRIGPLYARYCAWCLTVGHSARSCTYCWILAHDRRGRTRYSGRGRQRSPSTSIEMRRGLWTARDSAPSYCTTCSCTTTVPYARYDTTSYDSAVAGGPLFKHQSTRACHVQYCKGDAWSDFGLATTTTVVLLLLQTVRVIINSVSGGAGTSVPECSVRGTVVQGPQSQWRMRTALSIL